MDKKQWERINHLFLAALDRDTDERASFLDDACGDDPALRAEVEALLATDVDADGFLETPASITDPGLAIEEKLVGKLVGKYQLQGIISSGGMGTVYEALQKTPQRTVALKMMRDSITTRSTLRRFEYESEVLARLRHPGIAQVYEAGMHREAGDRDLPFFVMEYIKDARSITQYATDENLKMRETLLLFLQVLEAVHHGHQKGIIHRDLKPANILVDAQGRVKVIDFGIARAVESDQSRTTLNTRTGELMGTVSYMSPEQCGDDPQDLDVRSDVYTLGVVLFELLCHRIPYDLKNAGLIETIRAIREKEPIRPSSIPDDLQTILFKTLSKDRTRRYQSARELAVDLEHFLAREPIEARRDSTLYVIKKKLMQRPMVTALAAVAILISMVAILFAYFGHLDRRAKRSAEGERALDQALVEILCSRFDRAETCLETAEANDIDPGRICMLRGMAATERGDLDKAIFNLNIAVERLPDSLGVRALLLSAYLNAGQFDKVANLGAEISKMAPSTTEDYLYGGWIMGPTRPELSIQWLEHAARDRPTPSVQYLLGTQRLFVLAQTYDVEQIDLALATLLAAKTQMPENKKPAWLLSFTQLMAADIYRLRNNPTSSRFYHDKAKEEARRMMEANTEDAYPFMLAMSIALYEDRLEDALLHLRNAVPRPGFWPAIQFYTPFILHILGRYDEASAWLKELPEPFKTQYSWCMAHTFLSAEVYGIEAADTCFREWKERFEHLPRSFGHDMDYVIQSFLGRHEDAVQSSREYLRSIGFPRSNPNPFNIALSRFICDEITAEDLYKTATKRFERMHADFLIGMTHLSQGERNPAKARFAAVVNAGNIAFSSDFSSARWAYPVLRRLQEDPAWPAWIPDGEDGD